MKVILLRDVAKIGKRFEIVNVPDGYALNKLIPVKDAEPATPTNIKRINQNKARLMTNKSELLKEVQEVVDKINLEPLSIITESNEQGHLFKAVHAKDIVESAKKRNLKLSEDFIVINEPIKSVGEHKITIKLQDFSTEVIITIVAK